MSELHSLRVEAKTKKEIEAVSPGLRRDKLLWARSRSWEVFSEIKDRLRLGMTERDGFELAREIFKSHRVDRHWHKPFVRFGPGTMLSFHDSLRSDYRLKKNDIVYLDLGPVWRDSETGLQYEGDVGDSFVFGQNPIAEKCAQAARDVFELARQGWENDGLSGKDLFRLAKSETEKCGYELNEAVQGHRISDFPHHKYSKAHLGELSFQPDAELWILELHILDRKHQIGAFFEDLLRRDS